MKKLSLIIIVLIVSFSSVVFAQEEYNYPYKRGVDRDPLEPLVLESGKILIRDKKDVGDLFLQGILSSDDGNKAIINDEVYSEGDMIDEYVIIKISGNKVIIEKGGKFFTLKWEG